MKIIKLYNNKNQLIKKAAKHHRGAQQKLFDAYAPKMLSVCRRYIKDLHFAEDVMLTGFLKVFSNLNNFKFEGSFEGWVRKIMVNESISFLRKQKEICFLEDQNYSYKDYENITNIDLDVEQVQQLIDSLSEGYRMVFVLYAVEGYKHQEISAMLNISESTSKSQLFKARKLLQKKLNELKIYENDLLKVRR